MKTMFDYQTSVEFLVQAQVDRTWVSSSQTSDSATQARNWRQGSSVRLPTPGWDCMAMLQERRAEALECRFALEQQHLAGRDRVLAKITHSDDCAIFLRTQSPLMRTTYELTIASGLRAYGVAAFACSQSMASCFPSIFLSRSYSQCRTCCIAGADHSTTPAHSSGR